MAVAFAATTMEVVVFFRLTLLISLDVGSIIWQRETQEEIKVEISGKSFTIQSLVYWTFFVGATFTSELVEHNLVGKHWTKTEGKIATTLYTGLSKAQSRYQEGVLTLYTSVHKAHIKAWYYSIPSLLLGVFIVHIDSGAGIKGAESRVIHRVQ